MSDLTDEELAGIEADVSANEFPPDTAEELTRLIAEVRRRREQAPRHVLGAAQILCARCSSTLRVTRRDEWTAGPSRVTKRMDIEPCERCAPTVLP
jgi:hypothetical protein